MYRNHTSYQRNRWGEFVRDCRAEAQSRSTSIIPQNFSSNTQDSNSTFAGTMANSNDSGDDPPDGLSELLPFEDYCTRDQAGSGPTRIFYLPQQQMYMVMTQWPAGSQLNDVVIVRDPEDASLVRFSVPNQASPNEYTLGDIWLNGQGVIDDGQNEYCLELANNDYFFRVMSTSLREIDGDSRTSQDLKPSLWTQVIRFPTQVKPTVSAIYVGLSNGSSRFLPAIFVMNGYLLCFSIQEIVADSGVVNRVQTPPRTRTTPVNTGGVALGGNGGTTGYLPTVAANQGVAGFSGGNTNFT